MKISLHHAAAAAAFLLCAAGLSYFVSNAFLDTAPSVDFKYFWLAGDLWRQGVDPYTGAFEAAGARMFPDTNAPTWLFYPPSWYPLAQLVNLLPYAEADLVWRRLSGVLFVLGGLITIRALLRAGTGAGLLQVAAFVLFVAASSATAIGLSLGQSAVLLFLGLALFLTGYLHARPAWLVAGLILLMLKPNFGLAFVAFLLPQRRFWTSIAVAAAISILMALPPLLTHGFGEVLGNYLGQIGKFDGMDVNDARNTTGLRNVLFHLAGIDAGAFLLLGLACAISLAVGLDSRKAPSAAARVPGALLVLAVASAFVPMHGYDLVVLAPIILLNPRVSTAANILVAVALLVISRANNIATAAGISLPGERYYPGMWLASAMLAVLLAGLALHYRAARKERPRVVEPRAGLGPALSSAPASRTPR